MSTNLDVFTDLISAVQNDLNINDNSSQFPLATVKSAINRAYVNKITRLYSWPALEDAKMTSTEQNVYYYDAPANWVPDSIFRLEVDGVMYGEDPDGSPMDYHDWLTWKKNNPNSSEKKWARQWLRYFFSPTPTANGSNNICIWGRKTADKLVEDTDRTIFSRNMPEVNEAIVLEAGAILKKKGENNEKGQMLSTEAKEIVVLAYNNIAKNKSIDEKVQPFMYVPDYYGGSSSNLKQQVTGNF